MLKFMHKCIEKISIDMKKKINRTNYLTPKSYLELLGIYKKILKEKSEDMNLQLERLTEGMTKLMNAND